MNEKKFLQQVYGKLENQLEQEVKLADDSIEISEGDTISITTSDGTALETVTADKDAKGVVFSSDALVQNETYTLLINGEAAATAKLPERIGGENGIAEKNDKNNAREPSLEAKEGSLALPQENRLGKMRR